MSFSSPVLLPFVRLSIVISSNKINNGFSLWLLFCIEIINLNHLWKITWNVKFQHYFYKLNHCNLLYFFLMQYEDIPLVTMKIIIQWKLMFFLVL